MAWFRSLTTGREFSADGRWADAHRENADVVEIAAPGADAPPEEMPVSESDPALASLRKADLIALAAADGLPADGNKSELIARLTAGALNRQPPGDGGLPPQTPAVRT